MSANSWHQRTTPWLLTDIEIMAIFRRSPNDVRSLDVGKHVLTCTIWKSSRQPPKWQTKVHVNCHRATIPRFALVPENVNPVERKIAHVHVSLGSLCTLFNAKVPYQMFQYSFLDSASCSLHRLAPNLSHNSRLHRPSFCTRFWAHCSPARAAMRVKTSRGSAPLRTQLN